MCERERLTGVFKEAELIAIDDSSRIILFSDCHRGDGSWADDFSKNRNVYCAALTHYFNNGFTYIELGDGDELWKNKNFSEIIREYGDAFWLISRFIKKDRFYSLFGNHDFIKKKNQVLRFDGLQRLEKSEMESRYIYMGVKHREGLILWHRYAGYKIFLLHGHQADFFNDRLRWISSFLVRNIWRPLELLGFNDPTSPAKNYRKMASVERKLIDWVRSEKQMLIAGHTHRSVFPEAGEIPYFNDGCCVHPSGITGIEITEGNIMLVKWSIKVKDDGTLRVGRDILSGPRKLAECIP